jgi:uncharacterized protein YbjT (DUF2867 family)
MRTPPSKPVFLTGVSGYIGGRLVRRLLERGYRVRCLVRDARKVSARDWVQDEGVELVVGDARDADFLADAMAGCGPAFYLIHSMLAAGKEYRHRDRELAASFARAAEAAGLERIIYLGGLGEMGSGLSEHLRSRREVELALAGGKTPLTILRAAMIIGSGSASFEILRYLVERLPIMITPRWVSTECQPIAVRNALGYLLDCLEEPASIGRTLDIGGPEILSYKEIMHRSAEVLGLRRRVILPVPVLTPKLSSLWIHLITPADHRIARPLAEGLRNRVVCRDDAAQRLMPQRLLSVREAVHEALARERGGPLESTFHDAGIIPGDPDWTGGTVYQDARELELEASAPVAYRTLCRLGGRKGWYSFSWLWRLRGLMDRLLGGPGLRRVRRDSDTVAYGDALDFWRVIEVSPDRRLGLRAEMRLPGEAELSFELEPRGEKRCLLRQVARFKPRGLGGILYWFAVTPFHNMVFQDMIRGIRKEAEAGQRGGEGSARPASTL